MVKISDGGISGDEKATLDQGTDATQSNLELVNNCRWWVEHEGSLSDFLFFYLPRFFADSAHTVAHSTAQQAPVSASVAEP
jgi:hypothetical protein